MLARRASSRRARRAAARPRWRGRRRRRRSGRGGAGSALTRAWCPCRRCRRAWTPSQRWAFFTRAPLEPFLSGFAAAWAGAGARMAEVAATPAMASSSASGEVQRQRSQIRSFLRVASVERLRGELTGSRCLRYAARWRRFAPAALTAAPVPPFATARSGGDSAAVVLPPGTPATAGSIAGRAVRASMRTYVRETGRDHAIEALRLVAAGVNDCEIARRLGVPRTTVRDWRKPRYAARRSRSRLSPLRRSALGGSRSEPETTPSSSGST